MPAAVPLVAAAAGAAASASIAAVPLGLFAGGAFVGLGLSTATLGAIAGVFTSFAINAVGSRALTKKARTPGGGASIDPGFKGVVRVSDASQKIIYGRYRVGGTLVYAETANNGLDRNGANVSGTNTFLHMVIAMAGHEVAEIGQVYLNDTLLTIDANGWATSAPYTDSTSTLTRRSIGIAAISRASGVVTLTTYSAHGVAAGDSVIVDRPSGVSGGPYIVDTTPTSTTFTFTQAGPDVSLGPGGQAIVTSSSATFLSFVRVTKHFGTDDQLADPLMVAECPNWTADHRLRGIAYLYVRLQWNQDAFPNGIPVVNAVVRGKKVYDPRDVTQDIADKSTWKWTENSALCIRDYLTTRDAGNLPYGFGVTDAEINDDFTIAAANVCDEPITKLDGTVIPRYTCNGVLDTANAPIDNLQGLVTSLAGAVTCPKGRFRIHAGAYDAPSPTVIDESWLTGTLKSRNRTPRQELFNAVRGTYISEASGWQPTDFPPITSDLYEWQDDGERIYSDIELPFTVDTEVAQRIAKLIQRKGREQITVSMPVNYKGLQFSVWDTVKVNNAKRGWAEKVFRIENFSFDLTAGVNLQLKEENPASYDWTATDAQAEEAAPDTNLPSAFLVQPPKALEVTETTYVTRDGAGVKAKATMTWLASSDAFVSQYQPEYKLSTDTNWTVLPRTDQASVDINDIMPGIYNFRVKALNSLGVSSAYSTASKSISGISDPPIEPQNLTISTIGGFAFLTWDASVEDDVRFGGEYVFRHSPGSGATWSQSTTIGNLVSGLNTSHVLPLKPGTYLVKAVDAGGTESTDPAIVDTEQATALDFANHTTLTEDPTFAGIKSGCYVNGTSQLTIDGEALFDDLASFDSVPDLDASGGINPSATYEFSGGIDLTTVQRVRLTSHVMAEIINVRDQVDQRTELLDDWADFDGSTAAVADAVTYVRTTDDNPMGTPTWSAWNRLDSGEFFNRAFQFKLEMTSLDPAYNIVVDELSINVDQVN